MMDQDPPVPGPPSRAPGRLATTLSAFSVPGYPIAWGAYGATVAGWSASMVVIGWIALELSNSSFAVGATYAARLLPSLFLGIPMGALADRLERRTALSIINAIGAVALVLLAVRAATGSLSLVELLLASVVLGIVDTFRGTLSQSYVVDLAGPERATNALALSNLGAMLFGAVGAAVAGVVLDLSGPAVAFLVAAGGGGTAAGILLAGRRQAGTRRLPSGPKVDARRAMTLLFRNRAVALVTVIVILGEVLGWASLTLFPTFARDVLHTDATGLGAMTAARSIGGIGGAIGLASGARSRDGTLLLLTTGVFGLALVAFAASSVFVLSIGILVIVGGAMAALDTLGQTLVQRHVADHERGAAMGIWYFAIGFGPFGHLGLGGAAAILGAPLALAVSGGLLTASAVVLSLTARTRHL